MPENLPSPLPEEMLAKNRLIYDDATDAFWRLAVYEPLHQGWELSNLGGLDVLEDLGSLARLGAGQRALELGSGLGAACRYLASRFGCEVVGLELNGQQVEKAHRRLAGSEPEVARNVRFELGDLLDYRPDQLFDVVYTVDTLMLIEDIEGALALAARCLRPKGRIFLAEILAGPEIREETRRFVWDEDGMISLWSPRDYRVALGTLGFEGIDILDLNDLAVQRHDTMLKALDRHREKIVREDGEAMFERCVDLMSRYRRAFADRELLYRRIIGELSSDQHPLGGST